MDLFGNNPPTTAHLNISTKSAVMLQLARYAESDNEEIAQEATQYLEIIDREVSDLKVTWYGKSRYNIKIEAILNSNDKETADQIDAILKRPLFAEIMRNVLALPASKVNKPLKLEIALRSKKAHSASPATISTKNSNNPKTATTLKSCSIP